MVDEPIAILCGRNIPRRLANVNLSNRSLREATGLSPEETCARKVYRVHSGGLHTIQTQRRPGTARRACDLENQDRCRQRTGKEEMVMVKSDDIQERLVRLAVALIKVCDQFPETRTAGHIASQLLRQVPFGPIPIYELDRPQGARSSRLSADDHLMTSRRLVSTTLPAVIR
jgi:hypothetical protein